MGFISANCFFQSPVTLLQFLYFVLKIKLGILILITLFFDLLITAFDSNQFFMDILQFMGFATYFFL
jgi:hypothetical protein